MTFAQIIDYGDLMALFDPFLYAGGTDITGSAGDQNLHESRCSLPTGKETACRNG